MGISESMKFPVRANVYVQILLYQDDLNQAFLIFKECFCHT